MPYIITTLPEFHGNRANGAGFKQNVTRRAVATLDEARAVAFVASSFAPEAEPAADATVRRAAERQMRELTERGGTIGPLPDGTMIEVAHIKWIDLTREAGIDPHRSAYRSAEIITAYNARVTA